MTGRAEALGKRMARLGVLEADLEESFIRGAGAGGQKINKTSSTVRLRHRPTGVEVRCQEERSLAMNRVLARERLCGEIERRRAAEKAAVRQAAEQERRRKRPRPRRLKRSLLEGKRRRGALKRERGRPENE